MLLTYLFSGLSRQSLRFYPHNDENNHYATAFKITQKNQDGAHSIKLHYQRRGVSFFFVSTPGKINRSHNILLLFDW